MVRPYVLVTNNSVLSSLQKEGVEVLFLDGCAFNVVVAARDRVHLGWELLHHPLYGNFRPYHQPFRTLLLRAPLVEGSFCVDSDSLSLIEQATSVYETCSDRWLYPADLPTSFCDDCSFLDCELMKETLRTEGLLS